MLVRFGLVSAAMLAAACALMSSAEAAPRARGDVLILSGCTRYQPVACTMLDAGGTSYHLVGQSVPLRQGVTVRGRKVGDMGICFAPAVEVISWKPNRMRCPR